MGRNGERQTSTDLRREAALRRESIKRTAAALEDRLRARTDQLADAFDRTRDKLTVLDRVVHDYRYAFLGGAIGIGFALSRRRAKRAARLALPNGTRYVLVERARPSVFRSLVGGAAALALRHGVEWLLRSMDESGDEEPLLLPPARPPR
jgi:hypothetical protein